MTTAPVNPIAASLTDEQSDGAFNIGKQFVANKLQRVKLAGEYAEILGSEPTYELYELLRVQFVEGAILANPDNSANAADQAWKDFAALLESLHGITKPKSTSIAAQKKRTEREQKRAEVLAAYANVTLDDARNKLESAYMTLAKQPDNKNASAAIKNLKLVMRERQSEENKEHGAALKALRKQVSEAARKCTDIEVLQNALDLFESNELDNAFAWNDNDTE